jgi:hypothetical protein
MGIERLLSSTLDDRSRFVFLKFAEHFFCDLPNPKNEPVLRLKLDRRRCFPSRRSVRYFIFIAPTFLRSL